MQRSREEGAERAKALGPSFPAPAPAIVLSSDLHAPLWSKRVQADFLPLATMSLVGPSPSGTPARAPGPAVWPSSASLWSPPSR